MDMLYLQTLLHRYHMLEPYIYTSRPCHQNAIEPSTLFNQVSQELNVFIFYQVLEELNCCLFIKSHNSRTD